METIIKPQPSRFWIQWALFNTLVIPISYVIGLIAMLLVHGAFGFTMKDPGTFLSQTLSSVAGVAVLGFGAGLCQKYLLEMRFNVRSSWIYSSVLAFVVAEIIVDVILWIAGYTRIELRFLESNPLPEALIFAFIGLVAGFMQWLILRKVSSGSFIWIIASTIGWGLCFLVMSYPYVFPALNESILAMILFFCAGSLLYGVVTGSALLVIGFRSEQPSGPAGPLQE